MRERPILFNDAMVRAILSCAKTSKIYAPSGTDPLDPAHLARRIMSGIVRVDARGCWVWGRTTSAGYGCLTVAGKTVRAHRLALAIATGIEERDIREACHRCDNTLCVNPAHLFDGTHGDNVRDAVTKGRAKPPIGPIRRGEHNPSSRLTAAIVRDIRSRVARGDRQQRIAVDLGISQSTVSDIVCGRTWSHA